MEEFNWILYWKLEDIVIDRLNMDEGPRLKRFEKPEHIIERWARSDGEARAALTDTIISILKKDSIEKSSSFYTSLSHMVQRLDLKNIYPTMKEWFNRNYTMLRERPTVGKEIIQSLAVTQYNERPIFWEGLLLQPPSHWAVPTYKGLIRCNPDKASEVMDILLRKLKETDEESRFTPLMNELFYTKKREGKRESLIEAFYMKKKAEYILADKKFP